MKSLAHRSRDEGQDRAESPRRLKRQPRGNAAALARLSAADRAVEAQDEDGGFFGGIADSISGGARWLMDLVDDNIVDPISDFLFGEDEEQGHTEETPQTEAPVVEAPVAEPDLAVAEHVATDALSLVRTPPPALASTEDIIPVGTLLVIVSEADKDGRAYVEVEGEDGRAWGWTLKANLSSSKAHDPSMAVEEPLSIEGLSGESLVLAQLYNTKGAYLGDEAQKLSVGVEDTAAVLQAESGGAGFSDDGRMTIRFENHIFYGRWGSSNPETYNQHFKHSSGKSWTGHYFREDPDGEWESFHGDQSAEWRALALARSLDDTAGLLSISMGAAQIMGFNYESQGFSSVQEMFEQMNSGIRPQLEGMFTFIANNPSCLRGLQSGDYVQFARAYNGPGQAEAYGAIISRHAATLRGLLDQQQVG